MPENATIVLMAEEHGEIVTLEDGYVYFWPSAPSRGAYSAHDLRVLADELDRRNAAWDEVVRRGI